MLRSGLRGRGGAGFPAAKKWQLCRNVQDTPKYITCNADEGDPGAFMNRRVLEGDPHSVLEGMIIAAYAIGASYGYVYCRAEYPLAVKTLNIAIQQARDFGLLGENIMGSGFSFDLEVRMGAGAFVCGEETALIASIEGKRGEPTPRPPFPAVKGVWGKPTNNNNVETYANVPQIILKGADWFASMGTEKSKGTKTFAVGGDVKNAGLIEVPIGMTIREVVYDVGGGIKDGKEFKAVQIGGPMGGCLTAEHLDLPHRLRIADQGRRDDGLRRSGGHGRRDVHGGHRALLHGVHAGRIVRQVHAVPRGHQAHAGNSGAHLRRRRPGRRHRAAGTAEHADHEDQSVRSGTGRAATRSISTLKHFRHEYEAHIYEKKLPGQSVPPVDPVQHSGQLHGLYGLRAQLPGGSHQRPAPRRARDRSEYVHQVRYLYAGL